MIRGEMEGEEEEEEDEEKERGSGRFLTERTRQSPIRVQSVRIYFRRSGSADDLPTHKLFFIFLDFDYFSILRYDQKKKMSTCRRLF